MPQDIINEEWVETTWGYLIIRTYVNGTTTICTAEPFYEI